MIFVGLFFLQLIVLFFLSKLLTRTVYQFLYKITKSRQKTAYFFSTFFLIGTFVHEVAHFLTALFLLVPVGQPELMPEYQKGGLKLGSVPVGKTDPVRKFLIGVAPFVLGTGLIIGGLFYSISNGLADNLVVVIPIGYLVFSIGNTMYSSKRDMEGAIELITILIAIFLAFVILGIKLTVFEFVLNFSSNYLEDIKKANIFIAIPLGIDLVIIVFLKIILGGNTRGS